MRNLKSYAAVQKISVGGRTFKIVSGDKVMTLHLSECFISRTVLNSKASCEK